MQIRVLFLNRTVRPGVTAGFSIYKKMKAKNNDTIIELSEAEENFCYLLVFGGREFAGQHALCFEEAFGKIKKNTNLAARRLIDKPHIALRIKELSLLLQNDAEHVAIKMQITETLKAVMEEASTSEYTDRFGVSLSPAPLRAVAVNAAKALMDMYPVKHIHESRLKIEGANGNVIFNVIVPELKPNGEEE